MDTLAFGKMSIQQGVKSPTTIPGVKAKLQVIGAVAGLGGGTAAGIAGSLFTLASWLVVNEGARHWLSAAGSSLLLLTIPLIILSACCMDWEEKETPQRESKFECYGDVDD